MESSLSTSDRAAARRWRQLTTMLREQWVFAALLGIVWCGDVLFTLDRTDDQLLLIAASSVMVVLALVGWRYPVVSGLLAAVSLGASSGLVVLLHAAPYPVGLAYVQPAENAAGVLLVLYVFWKRRPAVAVPVSAALVASCLVAVWARGYVSELPSDMQGTLSFGFVQLILAVGTGMYLRGRPRVTPDTPLRALLRRQWPAMAALAVLLVGDLLSALDELPGGLIAGFGCLIMVGLAVLAPLRPVETALLGALSFTLMSVALRVFGVHTLVGGLSMSAVASGMLLVSFVTRAADPRRALLSGSALVASALFGLFVIPSELTVTAPSDLLGPMVGGGVLLVASVGTGMYFRSRDEEGARTVRDAVSHAQQNERLALARELHDVVAHHVTGIVVQAQAAQLVSRQNPQASVEALDRIAASGTEALTAMRRLVGSMRGVEPAGVSGATEQATMDLEADLKVIIARANRVLAEHNGPLVELHAELGEQPPQEVARSALRVVQESLTNSEKHAMDASRIQVVVQATAEHLRIRITDDGSGTRAHPVGGSGGYGLIGMRERIELLGGRFNAGPGNHIGWYVEAWLPLIEQEEEPA